MELSLKKKKLSWLWHTSQLTAWPPLSASLLPPPHDFHRQVSCAGWPDCPHYLKQMLALCQTSTLIHEPGFFLRGSFNCLAANKARLWGSPPPPPAPPGLPGKRGHGANLVVPNSWYAACQGWQRGKRSMEKRRGGGGDRKKGPPPNYRHSSVAPAGCEPASQDPGRALWVRNASQASECHHGPVPS